MPQQHHQLPQRTPTKHRTTHTTPKRLTQHHPQHHKPLNTKQHNPPHTPQKPHQNPQTPHTLPLRTSPHHQPINPHILPTKTTNITQPPTNTRRPKKHPTHPPQNTTHSRHTNTPNSLHQHPLIQHIPKLTQQRTTKHPNRTLTSHISNTRSNTTISRNRTHNKTPNHPETANTAAAPCLQRTQPPYTKNKNSTNYEETPHKKLTHPQQTCTIYNRQTKTTPPQKTRKHHTPVTLAALTLEVAARIADTPKRAKASADGNNTPKNQQH